MERPNTLVVGQPKSGTTALYTALKRSGHFDLLHEPSKPAELKRARAVARRPLLVKALLHTWFRELGNDTSGFDRFVLIVRDPRDILVSWLLYRPLLRDNWKNELFLSDFIEALREKEASPSAVSVHDLYGVLESHGIWFQTTDSFKTMASMEDQFVEENPSTIVIRYSDLLAGDSTRLADQFGDDVGEFGSLSANVDFNRRAGTAEGWRRWLTNDDLARLRPTYDELLMRWNFDRDWELDPDPRVDPSEASGYVIRSVERVKRVPVAFGILKPAGDYTEEYRSALESAVVDGSSGAILESGLMCIAGRSVPRNRRAGLALVVEAAKRGHVTAPKYLVAASRLGVPGGAAAAAQIPQEAAGVRSIPAMVDSFWADHEGLLPPVWRRIRQAASRTRRALG